MSLINAKKVVKLYTCSQSELYTGLGIAWNSQKKYEADFIAENAKYFAGIADVRRSEIATVMAMGDLQARTTESEVMRLRMNELKDELLSKWKSLRGYIRSAFKEAHFKPRIEEAGSKYYERAYRNNWEYVTGLAMSGKNFIDNHSATLLSDGGMPPGFAAGYGALQTEFNELYEAYFKRRGKVPELTDEKIAANNLIYVEGRAMMEDGKHIFRKEPSIRERFTWKHILRLMGEGSGRHEKV